MKFSVVIGSRDDLEEVRDLLARGIIRPVIARRFPLEHIADAHVEAEAGRALGSVIVTVQARGAEGRYAA